jgi:8-oxo-dGTP pyrophosphatase MutT (NUDIX family)
MPLDLSKLRLSELRRTLLARSTSAASNLPGQARAAAVAAVLREAPGGVEVLLIRRAEHERDPWSGHMALPGGHQDAGDADLVATALRETHEEVGLTLDRDSEWIGALPRARVLSGRRPEFEILPLVFAVARHVVPRPNPREVKAVVWAKIDDLLLPAAHTSILYPSVAAAEGQLLPAFDVQGHVVWGLTYRILSDLLAVWGEGASR